MMMYGQQPVFQVAVITGYHGQGFRMLPNISSHSGSGLEIAAAWHLSNDDEAHVVGIDMIFIRHKQYKVL